MSLTLGSNGTTSALIIGTETVLTTDNTNAFFTFVFDTSNMVIGDVLVARIYTAVSNGGALIQAWEASFGPSPQVNNAKISMGVPSIWSLKCTLTQTAGTGRTFPWELLRI
jgi:hypothetical protein